MRVRCAKCGNDDLEAIDVWEYGVDRYGIDSVLDDGTVVVGDAIEWSRTDKPKLHCLECGHSWVTARRVTA